MAHVSFTELIPASVQSDPCFHWMLKTVGDQECVFFFPFDNLYFTHQALLGYFRKRFHAPYLGILHSSFHLKFLQLLPFFCFDVFFFHFLWFLSVMIFLDFSGIHFLVLSVFACSLYLAIFASRCLVKVFYIIYRICWWK